MLKAQILNPKHETRNNDLDSNDRNQVPAAFPFWTLEHLHFDIVSNLTAANGRRRSALVRAQGPDDEGEDLPPAGKGCR